MKMSFRSSRRPSTLSPVPIISGVPFMSVSFVHHDGRYGIEWRRNVLFQRGMFERAMHKAVIHNPSTRCHNVCCDPEVDRTICCHVCHVPSCVWLRYRVLSSCLEFFCQC